MAKKTVGLALSFGGIRGLAHIGVIKCFEDNGIKIDYIAGCSTGALVGAIYCQHGDIAEVERFYKSGTPLLTGQKYLIFLEYRRKLHELRRQLDGLRFSDLKIPFAAVASDITSGLPHIFTTGELYRAVAASVAIPVVMPKVHHHQHVLVDGGLTMPLPCEIVRQQTDICVAVNLFNNVFPLKTFNNLGKINDLICSCFTSINQLLQFNLALAHYVIEPRDLNVIAGNTEDLDKMIAAGYEAALPIVHRLQSSL